ncbi:MAG: tetratricopeptide repeat protein [Bacteriovoracaceae bacterium]
MLKGLTLCLSFIFLTACATTKEKSKHEKQAEIYYSHGTRNLVDKSYTEALNNLLKANRLTPDDSKILNNLGMAYYFKGDIQNAIIHIKSAIQKDDKNFDAYVNLASIYYNTKKINESRKLYMKVSGELTYRHQYRVLYNLALIDWNKGDSRSALKFLDQAIAENESYCPAYFLKGRIYEVAKKYKSAYEAFRKSYLGVCVNSPAPHYRAALMLSKIGETHKSRMKYYEIIDRFPTSKYSAKARTQIVRLKENHQSSDDVYSQLRAAPTTRSLESKRKKNRVQSYQSQEF